MDSLEGENRKTPKKKCLGDDLPQGHAESMHNLAVKLYFGEGMDSDRRGKHHMVFVGQPSDASPSVQKDPKRKGR